MQTKDYALGIDTSNYTTSVAIVRSDGQIICDLRKQLKVKQGERGLRQSHALFQHIETLPGLFKEAVAGNTQKIAAVAVSSRPRAVEASYMPVFKAGESFAAVIAGALDVPVYSFSHQEGHIEAVKRYSGLCACDNFLCYHLSGGTCELLRVKGDVAELIGGTKDISFGQLIDRIGVRMGMAFPCGAEFDKIATESADMIADSEVDFLTEIPLTGLQINLSGMETQVFRKIEDRLSESQKRKLVKKILNNICNVIIKMTENAVFETKMRDVLFAGGVSSSLFLHNTLHRHFDGTGVKIDFGNRRLASDNAVGIALLGGKKVWH